MKKIIRILNLDIHSLNNAEYKNFMERFFKLIPLKAVSGEGDRPSELRLLGEEENMTSDFVGISDEDKATFNADMLLLTDVVNQSRTNDNTALLLNLDKRRDPLVSFIINTTSIGRKSSNPAYAQACISLYNILKPYRGIQNIPMQQETAQIKGMLYDLDKPENKQKITLLHLDDTVSELRNVRRIRRIVQRQNQRTGDQCSRDGEGNTPPPQLAIRLYHYHHLCPQHCGPVGRGNAFHHATQPADR